MNSTGADLQASFIRTLVPMIVGFLVNLGAQHGFNIDSAEASSAITIGASYVFYVAVRYLETHQNSSFGWLLGAAKVPVYTAPPAVVTDQDGTRQIDEPPAS